MGLLDMFSKKTGGGIPDRLPSGSFTVDPHGEMVGSTVPQSVSPAVTKEIGQLVLTAFIESRAVNLPMTELVIEYGSYKIKARELRGGAMVFLAPRSMTAK